MSAGVELSAERRARVRRAGGIALVALAVVTASALSWRWFVEYHRNVVDDALISMVYARRLATGDGLVFNPGERVEGYTNFLWTVTLAPVYWLSRLFRGDFVDWCVGTSVLMSAIDLGLVALVARRLWGDRVLPLALALGWCVLDNSYTVWAMMALEGHYVALWVLATLAVWTSSLRHRELATGLCLAAVPMARPDGALFVGAFALSEALHVLVPLVKRDRVLAARRLRALALAGGVAAAVFGAYFAWRWRYYGWPLPNTYYLKLGSSSFDGTKRGLEYLKGFLDERADLPLLALLAVPFLRNATLRTLALWVVVHLAYVANQWRGDHAAGSDRADPSAGLQGHLRDYLDQDLRGVRDHRTVLPDRLGVSRPWLADSGGRHALRSRFSRLRKGRTTCFSASALQPSRRF